MISITQNRKYVKREIVYVSTEEKHICPICGGKLSVHGTCSRKVRDNEQVLTYHLRVMKCRSCSHTHRELPLEIIPYKRHSAANVCNIVGIPEKICPCELSTRLRLKAWLDWFLIYAANLCRSLGKIVPAGIDLLRQLTYYVRLSVNSGNWVQHRSAMTFP